MKLHLKCIIFLENIGERERMFLLTEKKFRQKTRDVLQILDDSK